MPSDLEFEKLYNEYYFRILHYIHKRIGQMNDAEDLTQNAFLYCYQHFSEFDERKASFGTWLFLIVNSRIKNYYRDQKLTVNLDDLSELLPSECDFTKAIELEEMRKQVFQALNQCPTITKEIIVMKFFRQMKALEISKTLGISEANVRIKLHRGLKNMERYLEERKDR